MARKNMAARATGRNHRSSSTKDPAVSLWRAFMAARADYEACADRQTELYGQLPGLLRNGVEFMGTQYFTVKGIAQKRDAVLADQELAPCSEECRKVSAKADEAIRRIKVLTAARKAAERVTGAAAAERAEKIAERKLDAAEAALIAGGFTSTAAIVAGLHLMARASSTESLYEWPAELLRRMVMPLLAKVPADMADAFLKDWPKEEVSGKGKEGGAK